MHRPPPLSHSPLMTKSKEELIAIIHSQDVHIRTLDQQLSGYTQPLTERYDVLPGQRGLTKPTDPPH